MNDNQVATLASTITGNGWVVAGLGTSGSMAALDATMTPIDALAAAGLGFLTEHVQPLQDVVDRMAGRTSVIHSFADAWQRVSAQVDQVQGQLARSAATDTAQWQGDSGDRYRTHAAALTSALSQVVELATAAGSATTTMGQALASGRQQAVDLLTDLVQRLVSFVSQAIATEGGVTSNVLAQATSMISSYTSPISAIEQQVRRTVDNIEPQLAALANAIGGTPTANAVAGAPAAQTQPVAASATTRGLRLAQATEPEYFLDSLRGGATIHLPNGSTIQMKPGGEYVIPRGSRIIRDGEVILDEKTNPHGLNMRDDGTKVRVLDTPDT